MKYLVYTFLMMIFTVPTFSQDLNWAHRIGGTGDDRCFDLTHDSAGNIYITGGFCNSVNFNPNGTSYFLNSDTPDNSDIYLAKYDSESDLVWAFSLGNTEWELGLTVKTDPLNNVYVAGNYNGTVDFDPGEENFSLTTTSMSYFLAKYNSLGEFEWVKDIGNDGNNYLTVPSRTRIFPDQYTNVYSFIHKNDTLKKFDSDGKLIWRKHLSGTPVRAGNHAFYFVDGFKVPFEYESFYQDSIRVNKIDTDGNLIFSGLIAEGDNEAAGNYTTIGGYITYDNNGNLLLSGTFWGKIKFYNQVETYYIENYDTAMISPGVIGPVRREFIAKTDTLGNTKWVKSFNGTSPHPYIIRTNPDGEIFTLGSAGSTTNFDPSGSVYISGPGNHYIARYDSLFNYQACSMFLGGSGNDFVGNFEMFNDTALIGGHFFNTIDVDLTNSNYLLSATPPEDIFFARYSNFNIYTNPVSIDAPETSSENIMIYPNPTSGKVSVKTGTLSHHSTIKIYDMLGHQLLSKKTESCNTDIDLSGFSNGIYYVKLINNNQTTSFKLIKQ